VEAEGGKASAVTEGARAIVAPLGAEEERRAVEAALAHLRRDAASMRIHGAELAIEKAKRRGQTPARRVRVLLAARGSSAAHEVFVDASGGVVTAHEHASVNLPYLPDEVEEATAIARRDPRVEQIVERRTVGVGTFAPRSDEEGHRLVGLHYLDVEDPYAPQPLATVVVDLATGEVGSFRDDAAGSPEGGA
jgi:hypothetical protein